MTMTIAGGRRVTPAARQLTVGAARVARPARPAWAAWAAWSRRSSDFPTFNIAPRNSWWSRLEHREPDRAGRLASAREQSPEFAPPIVRQRVLGRPADREKCLMTLWPAESGAVRCCPAASGGIRSRPPPSGPVRCRRPARRCELRIPEGKLFTLVSAALWSHALRVFTGDEPELCWSRRSGGGVRVGARAPRLDGATSRDNVRYVPFGTFWPSSIRAPPSLNTTAPRKPAITGPASAEDGPRTSTLRSSLIIGSG